MRRNRSVGHSPQESETDHPHDSAEGEGQHELPRLRRCRQPSSGSEQGGHDQEAQEAGPVGSRLITREVAPPQFERHQAGDPRQPGAAGDTTAQVETEERDQEEDQLSAAAYPGTSQWRQRHQEGEDDPSRPSRHHEALVANAIEVRGGRYLSDGQQWHHAGHDSQHGGTGMEGLRVEHHRPTKNHLERQRVEHGKPIGMPQLEWAGGWLGHGQSERNGDSAPVWVGAPVLTEQSCGPMCLGVDPKAVGPLDCLFLVWAPVP